MIVVDGDGVADADQLRFVQAVSQAVDEWKRRIVADLERQAAISRRRHPEEDD